MKIETTANSALRVREGRERGKGRKGGGGGGVFLFVNHDYFLIFRQDSRNFLQSWRDRDKRNRKK